MFEKLSATSKREPDANKLVRSNAEVHTENDPVTNAVVISNDSKTEREVSKLCEVMHCDVPASGSQSGG